MIRGSTPTLTFELPIDLREARVYLTFEQALKVVLEKTNESMVIGENFIQLTLSQEDTIAFTEGGVNIQLRYIQKDGQADVSDIARTSVTRVIKDGVIKWN